LVIGLPCEEKRCFLEDLFLFFEDLVLAAKAAELISVLTPISWAVALRLRLLER
jgi:hypothetical protein